MSPVHLYAEDALCGELGAAIVRHVRPESPVVQRVTNGFGKIRNDLAKYANLASYRSVLVIVDLDQYACPSALLHAWNIAAHACPGMAFRIAVRECESWLMADAVGAARYFGVTAGNWPRTPDDLAQPKDRFLTLLRQRSKGRKRVLEDVLPARGSTSPVGLGYNVRLSEFIRTEWSIERAASRSDSLARAIAGVRSLPGDP